MNTFSFTDAQVEVLRLALIHELNENSYFKGLCKTEEQRRRVNLARAAIEDVYCIINNRRQEKDCVDKVANNAGNSENE